MSFVKVCQVAAHFAEKLKKVVETLPEEKGPRRLRHGEGDNVDKVGDMRQAILYHLDSICPLVDDGQMDQAEDNAKAIEHLAQALQFMIREMDPENG